LELVVVRHLLLVRVGAAAAAVALVDMLVRVLKVTHHLPLLVKPMPQQLVVVVLLEQVMVATAQQVVLHKVAVVVLMEHQIWVATVATVETLVVVVAEAAVQQLSSTQVQAVLVVTHRSRYGCLDEISRIERRRRCRECLCLGWFYTVFARWCCTTPTVCR
jgi:hypothetical protein